MILFRFSQIIKASDVRVQVQASAKQKRFERQMANRQLVVPANIKKQQQQVITA